ncbi:MAG: LysR family transcriptional regulator [Oscillospiraceae bacterium]|nr:LysR family transcriptional regulator [Oscillospiraceae bacterium]
MSLKKYEAVRKVFECGSMTLAARELGYTQSGISHMITSLEDELGVQLLVRKRGGTELTQEGELLMPKINELLNLNDSIVRMAREQGKGGTVKIGAFTSVAVNWLPGILKAFRSSYPEYRVNMLNGDYHDVEAWLAEGEVDLGFVAIPGPTGCDCIPLKEDPLSVIVPLGHPFCSLNEVPIDMAAREPIISLLESSAQDVHRALDSAGVNPEIRYTTKDDYAIIAMVREGLGISIMPELLLRGQISGVAVRRLTPPVSRTIALAVAGSRRNIPAVKSFAACVTQWIQQNT